MEETKILENHENLPANDRKALNAHVEIKESISHEPSGKDEVLKPDPVIPSAEKEPEAKSVTTPEAVADTSNQEQTLNETVPDQNPKQTEKEEPNPKENSTETTLKSQAPAKDQNEAKESTASTDLKAKPTIEDHQVTETTEADQQEGESKATPQAVKEQKKDKSKKTKSSALKKPVNNDDQTMTAEQKLDIEEQESYRKDSAKEVIVEQDRRKTWRSLLTEVSLVSSLSTFRLLYDKSSTPESSDAAAQKRSAKKLYKKKIQILRENYTYRLGLLKQLKEAMRDKYNREAQQLYSDYSSTKRKHRFLKKTNIHAEDLQEPKVTDPCEDAAVLSTLG